MDTNLGSTAAIPLFHGTEVFGVIQLYFDSDFDVQNADKQLLEAIGTRVAPLMMGSLAFERSQANALTDITTELPNERAFYLILENQIAEAQRRRDERPLTVLAIDIRNFDEINQQFGHAAGDRALNFVAQVVKDNLRQMDFLARSTGDEFLVVLPTASQDITDRYPRERECAGRSCPSRRVLVTSEGMTLAAAHAQLGDLGACRRR